ncbi:MAG TPA: 3-hydroxyisobutyrate dehydrogenase [Hyphomicrobiaceae bacterium]|nr:3-hydroxyisobutyrate dehydrogenase [Hyphomicrobiaceae bacterium]
MARVGFIGLGNMGLPMVRNLVSAGHAVTAFDIVKANTDAAVAAGAKAAATVEGAGEDADIVITMLPKGEHTLQVYEGSGILNTAGTGTLFVDCSSIDVASALRAHELAGAAGFKSLDAPVSGGIVGAQRGTLTLMVGGEAATVDAARAVLDAVSSRVVHCGGPGSGQIAKMCNQMMVATNMAICAEAFAMAEKMGLDAKLLYDVVNTSSGQSFAMTSYVPVPGLIETGRAEHNFEPGFTTELLLKDVNIFQAAAQESGLASPIGQAVAKLYEGSIAAGNGGKDYSIIIEYIKRMQRA